MDAKRAWILRTNRAGRCLLGLVGVLCACAVYRGDSVTRIGLLAPFEGRYREVGYNALYAARLALQDSGIDTIEMLPVDDGGTAESAASRARALNLDPTVGASVVLGYSASDASSQQAFGDLPVLIVGNWSALPTGDSVFVISAPGLDDLVTTPSRVSVTEAARLDAPLIGGELLALAQFSKLRDSLDGITIVSSSSLPDADFEARYAAPDEFAPEPGLLATLTYDAVNIAVRAAGDDRPSREAVRRAIAAATYTGLNGTIRFDKGYWADAPIHYFTYDVDRKLIAVNDIVK